MTNLIRRQLRLFTKATPPFHAVASFALLWSVLASVSPVDADQMAGRWLGNWVSYKNGHNGPLNAQFRPINGNQYRATFTGRFAKVIPFRYRMKMQVQGRSGDTIYFGGSRSMLIFGRFDYQACATPDQFVATYRSRRDRGRFEMRKQ